MQFTSLSFGLVPTATGDFQRYKASDIAILPCSYSNIMINMYVYDSDLPYRELMK